ncbi:MAG TPA: hypothetical protein VFX86_01040 [Candidatus Saccharimonadales bacterium]|nr:hypothetical protein [Candidatus Saccharimonadales bacterium]
MKLLDVMQQDFPTIKFIAADRFQWSPEEKVIYFVKETKNGEWSLLHEGGHMLCKHLNYTNDMGLLRMEVEAWAKAQKLAKKYGYKIDQKHIDKCLDTYRDWIHKRSSCPRCTLAGVEKETGRYYCINCGHRWKVSSERFCRTYRKTVTV